MSKVIKGENLKDSSVFRVNYEALVGTKKDDDEGRVYLEADGFAPLFFTDHLDTSANAEMTEAEGAEGERLGSEAVKGGIPEGMVLIAEEDLHKELAEAHERGVEEGRQIAERGLAHVFRALRQGAESLVSLRERVLRESEGDLLKLSCLVAKKIILREISQDPGIIANIVAATVACCSEQDKITIRLNPGDYQKVMADRQVLSGVIEDESRVAFSPDDSIKLGGCLVDTPTGTVDARIEAQLDEVYSRCLEERGIIRETVVVPVEE